MASLREKILAQQQPLPQIRCLVANGKRVGQPRFEGAYLVICRKEPGNNDVISSLSDSRVIEAWETDTGKLPKEWHDLEKELNRLYPFKQYERLFGAGVWGTSLLHYMQE